MGILGGIGSGKSTVARALAECGATVLDADQIARREMQSKTVLDPLVERFGPGILDAAGNLDRAALAARVFTPGQREEKTEGPLALLESLLHPAVRRTIVNTLHAAQEEAARSGEKRMIVLDIPLLVEKNWHELCHHLIFVDTPDQDRLGRVMAHRGWTEKDWRARESLQTPLDTKRRLAQTVVPNHDLQDSTGREDEHGTRPMSSELRALYRRLLTE